MPPYLRKGLEPWMVRARTQTSTGRRSAQLRDVFANAMMQGGRPPKGVVQVHNNMSQQDNCERGANYNGGSEAAPAVQTR